MLTKWKRLAMTFNAVRKSEGDVHAGIRFFDAMSDILGRGEGTMIGLMRASESGKETSLESVTASRIRRSAFAFN